LRTFFHPPNVYDVVNRRLSGIERETHITQKIESPAERRKAIRYRMSTPVIFRWKGPNDELFQGEGVTRDMSVVGIFILTSTCPPANAVVQMEVLLPVSDGASNARMKSELTVLRVEHDVAQNNRSGFSAVGAGFSLRTFSKKATRAVTGMIKESESAVEKIM